MSVFVVYVAAFALIHPHNSRHITYDASCQRIGYYHTPDLTILICKLYEVICGSVQQDQTN